MEHKMIEKKDGIDFKTEDLDKTWVSFESLLPELNKILVLAYGSKLKNTYYHVEEIIERIKKEMEKKE